MEKFVDSSLHEVTRHGTSDFPAVVYKDSYRFFADRFYYAHYHQEIEILVAEHGEMEIEVNQNKYHLNEGDVIFINANNLHKINHYLYKESIITPFLFDASLISGPNTPYITKRKIDEILNKSFEAVIIKDEKIVQDLLSLRFEYVSKIDGYEIDYVITMLKVINYISINYDALKPVEKVSSNNKRVRKALEYIFKYYSEDIKVADIANEMDLSIGEACRLFKKMTGLSIIDYVLNYRINIATNLLKDTDKSITDIAFEVGFTSSNYFTIAYKKITGKTPREARK